MADASAPTRPQRAPALLSTIGGALMIVSYFLPDYFGSTGAGPSSFAWYRLWDVVLRAGNLAQNQTSGSSQPHVFLAVLYGIPLLLGVVIAALGVVGLLRAPGDLRRGFGVAAVIFVLVQSITPLEFATYSAASAGQVGLDESLVGLGSVTLALGLFLVTAAAFAQPRRAA